LSLLQQRIQFFGKTSFGVVRSTLGGGWSVKTFQKVYLFLNESVHFGSIYCYFGFSEAIPAGDSTGNFEDLIVFLERKKLDFFLFQEIKIDEELTDKFTGVISA
jgi:hypothetical protein